MKLVLIDAWEVNEDAVASSLAERGANGPFLVDWLGVEVRARCHAAWRIITREGRPFPYSTFAGQLDVPQAAFDGLSPRNAYQQFVERFLVPTFGKRGNDPRHFLGDWLLMRLKAFIEAMRERFGTVIVPDVHAYPQSILPLLSWCRPEDTTLLVVRPKGQSSEIFNRPSDVRICRVTVSEDQVASEVEAAFKAAAPHLFLELPPEKTLILPS